MTGNITKSCLTVSVALIILSIFCLFGTQGGTASFFLSAITLAINIVFSGILIGRMIFAYIKNSRNENISKGR